MFQFEANEAVILEQQRAIEAALSTNPDTERVLRRIIRKYVLEARREVTQGIHFAGGDPRQARQAVRTSVYRKVLGANINIFSRKKAGGQKSSYEPPRTLRSGQRGGNRVKRGANTQRMMDYGPLDRGMVLRWQNEGTGERTAGTRGGHLSGNRGAVPAKNFFRSLGDRAMGQMRDTLSQVIESELARILTEKTK